MADAPTLRLAHGVVAGGLLLAGLVMSACTTANPMTTRTAAMNPSDDGMEPSPSPSSVAYQDIARSLQVQSVIKYTGDADLDFRNLLQVFNEHAAQLARAELQHGTSPELRRLAEEVLAHRKAETPEVQGARP